MPGAAVGESSWRPGFPSWLHLGMGEGVRGKVGKFSSPCFPYKGRQRADVAHVKFPVQCLTHYQYSIH